MVSCQPLKTVGLVWVSVWVSCFFGLAVGLATRKAIFRAILAYPNRGLVLLQMLAYPLLPKYSGVSIWVSWEER